jgi:FlaA1/EpsC-like NDP-sugar epimerase
MLPYVITAKLVAFSAFRLYRGLWRTILIEDVYRIFKAASLGTLILIAGSALANRLLDLSRVVLIVDWLLTFLAILGTRTAISGFRRWSWKLAEVPYKAALLGSPALADFLREAIAREEGINFSGTIVTEESDIPLGRPEEILGTAESLKKIVADKGIDILFVATDKCDEALSYLAAEGIMIRQVRMHFS